MKRKTHAEPLALDIDLLLHRKPGHLIRRLQQMAVSIFLEETAEFEVTPVQYAAIAAVSVYPGIDQLRLANAIGFDRTTISGVIDRLEAKGLVVRQVSEEDRRAKLLFPTAAGERLLQEIQDATERVQQRILAPLNAGEQKSFLEFLNRLVLSHNHSSRVPIDKALIPSKKVSNSARGGRKG
ncbi:MAG: MarR family transcriptional regulator, lower aerobic nicotinate degradation pathway regulator [Bradyrhizobium sp.]|jgi:DNA-binding MarR family transcriptional regulator